MDKGDIIWTAAFILDRGPIDAAQLITAGPNSADVTNSEGPVQEVTFDQMAQNAINWTSQVMGEDPSALDLISVTWVLTDFIDASEMPPPPPLL